MSTSVCTCACKITHANTREHTHTHTHTHTHRHFGVARHLSYPIPNTLKKAKSGYAVVIRNMALQPIRVSGKLLIRKPEFPCTLVSCCQSEPTSACCPRNYTRLYTAPDPTCGKCSRVETDPNCRPYESSQVPSWSARGPAKVQKSSVDREVQFVLEYGAEQAGAAGWQKPDLVAPGTERTYSIIREHIL